MGKSAGGKVEVEQIERPLGDISGSKFMEYLPALGPCEDFTARVVRFVLSLKMRANALQDLSYKNISHATLLPGLEGKWSVRPRDYSFHLANLKETFCYETHTTSNDC
jgi:hypothetical protein